MKVIAEGRDVKRSKACLVITLTVQTRRRKETGMRKRGKHLMSDRFQQLQTFRIQDPVPTAFSFSTSFSRQSSLSRSDHVTHSSSFFLVFFPLF